MPTPEMDWHTEHASQQRDLSRFSGELDRNLSLRSRNPTVRASAERLREQWERLKRRLNGRAARFGDQWDRQLETAARLRLERDRLRALVDLDERLADSEDLEPALNETLACVSRSMVCDGALIVLYDIGGRTRRVGTDRGRGRSWPAAADQELADTLAMGARSGRRITIEGRPVGTGPRERGRAAHWMAIPVQHAGELYGAIVTGRSIAGDAFSGDDQEALAAITRRLGRVLATRIGVAARPMPGGGPRPEGFEQLWGQDQAFKQALALAANYALSDVPILIEGETGTGRETLARAIHRRSARSEGPFVVVKAESLPENVIAESLFGVNHVLPDGSTGERPGNLELAQGGTLFIDEVAALGPVLQVRLLQYLKEGTFERDGDRTLRRTNVRIVLATAEDLDRLVSEGRFRQDLYYLVTVARIWLPPLRERGADIVDLARRFAQVSARKAGRSVEGIDVSAAHRLAAGAYPGNVKQLAQIIERAVLLGSGPLIAAADLPERDLGVNLSSASEDTASMIAAAADAVRAAAAAGTPGNYHALKRAKKAATAAVERAFVETVLRSVGRNWSRAARHCGIHRAQWQRLLRASAPPVEGKDREQVHNPADGAVSDT